MHDHSETPAATDDGTDADGTDTDGTDTDGIVVFWRPGCGFCASLMYQLEGTGLPLYEVNIWEDPRAAATVRSIANGNETVPCVVVGEFAMVNPSVGQVLAAVADHAPHLLPAAPG